ncbi:MAG: hypothetical protein HGGPFJEG_01951 [Ignavibacteria bacterium]|nr:hypothetical protein [Ignavibacteria bacterium]
MFLNIVTDDQLLTSQIVKTILLVIILAGIIHNLYRIFRKGTKGKKIINLILLLLLIIVMGIVIRQYLIEASLLKSSLYITGTTIGYCNVFAEGPGIEFEYEIDGQKYINCNTYHPISKDSIKVPGGKYFVRYSNEFQDQGRIDFNKKAE